MQHILISHNYLTRGVEASLKSISSFFDAWFETIARSRQCNANRKIAPMLKCEYPHMSELQILDMLNRQTFGLDTLPQGDNR